MSPRPHNVAGMRPSARLDRFVSVSALAARVYGGYKRISLAERHLRIKDAAARRSAHHTWSARQLYDLAIRRQGLFIKRQVVRELGRPLADVFAEFDEASIAAASLAQVPRARLKDGREVAVKVQYPGIWDIVQADLSAIRFLLRVLAALERNLDFTPIIQELSRTIPQELDFINEGHNAELIARNFAGREDIIVPNIFWEYTTQRVLVMEYL